MSSKRAFFSLLSVSLSLAWCAQLWADKAPYRVATDYATPGSLTCGIQEAIDALAAGGGSVYVPEGTYVLHRPIKLKPNVKLMGAGKATVLKKDPGFKILLAEDAKNGQNYVVVQDASRLKQGMAVAIGDKKHAADIWSGMFLITKIEGNKLFINHILGGGGLRSDLTVADQACLMNLFMVILPASDCIIEDMEIDGNANEQMVEEAINYHWPYGMLWCGIYPANQLKVNRCWIHDAGIGIHVNGRDVEISHCQIYHNRGDGIHCGGGPGSFITNNRIYDNQDGGITFCFGNKGLVITNNQIYGNGTGIGALGSNDPANDLTPDQITIISNNIIYRNRYAAIASGQGPLGPQDFVFTGNIVKDNNLQPMDSFGVHSVPAGISLYNAKRCVVTGNCCLDDQDAFPRKLSKSANAGQSIITVPENVFQVGSWVIVSEGQHREIHQVVKKDGGDLTLSQKLAHSYQVGAQVAGLRTQLWGIFVGGPEAQDNVVAENVCEGNILGGVLWQGANTRVTNNAGKIFQVDETKPLIESIYPTIGQVNIPDAGFEQGKGWSADSLSKGGAFAFAFAEPGRSGKRALKLTCVVGGSAGVASQYFSLKPRARYRLSAWVKSSAKRGDQVVLPHLFLASKEGRPAGAATYAVPTLAAQTWVRVSTEAFTDSSPVEARIHCRLVNAAGEAWVDDLQLEILQENAISISGVADKKPRLTVSAVGAPMTIDGRLDEPAWPKAAKAEDFLLASGKKPVSPTAVSICRDNQNLYIAFRCDDPSPAQIKKDATKETEVFADDAVAVLLQPDIHIPYHFQFAVSASGARFDQISCNGFRDTPNFSPEWKAATKVTDKGWTAEIAIPLSVILPMAPAKGQAWGANFGRRNRDGTFSSWAATENWHAVEDYGRLVF